MIYVNVKDSNVYDFVDDTNMLQSDNSLKKVAKKINFDLKNLSQ